MIGLRGRRNAAFESFDFAKGRADLKRRRQANLDRLPELLEQFTERLAAVGGAVHLAKDATEARDIIGQLCWNAGSGLPAGARMVVTKVKSMASEEIELNPYLEGLGIEVVETDLGERMVQLTHTHPSHLIAPAIHLTKEDAAQVFGTEPTVEAIQQHARDSLRKKFIDATVGISGANMTVAETGTIVLVCHERHALPCIRCVACSNACPPFMAVSGHQFGHIYNGPIGLVLTPFHHGLDTADLPNTLCVQCNACQEICPVDIPLPRQILEHRRAGRKSLRKQALVGVWKKPKVADRLLRAAAPLTGLVPGTPRLAQTPYRDRVHASRVDGEPLTIFASCLADRVWPESAVALERIATAAGFQVGFPKEQWCCGLIAANAGDFAAGAELSGDLTASLRDSKGLIVTPSASCFGAFTIDAPDWGARSDEGVRGRMRDSTRFVLQLLESNPKLADAKHMSLKIAYHDSCQSLRQLGLKSEPRRVLELAGYEVVDLPDIANCCGFGGTFSLEWPRVADRLAEWKLDAIAKTGCEVIASDNPGCLMHIAAAARKRHMKLRVAHVLELVAEHLA